MPESKAEQEQSAPAATRRNEKNIRMPSRRTELENTCFKTN
jgi:hypothetical protein